MWINQIHMIKYNIENVNHKMNKNWLKESLLNDELSKFIYFK